MLDSCFVYIKKPSITSNDFYRRFYRFYSLIQINDLLLQDMINHYDSLVDQEQLIEMLKESLYTSDERLKNMEVSMIGMGRKISENDRKFIDSKKIEDRNLDYSLVEELIKKKVDFLQWYIESMEFMILYSLYDDTLKSILEHYNVNLDEKGIEGRLLEKVFNALRENKVDNDGEILQKLSQKYKLEFKGYSKIKGIHKYFYNIRNLFMHSEGRISEGSRFIKKMNKYSESYGDKINKFWGIELKFNFEHNKEQIFLWNDDSTETNLLNFFRNFITNLIEVLDEVID